MSTRIRIVALTLLFSACLLIIQACDLSRPAIHSPEAADAGEAGLNAGIADLRQPALVGTTVEVPAQYQSIYNGPTVITMPIGFHISVYAAGLGTARLLTFGACNDLFAGSTFSYTTRLPDRNHDGVADSVLRFNSGLTEPAASIEYYNNRYYVATGGSVERFDQTSCDAGPSNQQTIISGLEVGGGHFTRTAIHGPDGALYLSIGSSCNLCLETDPKRAAITRLYNGQVQVYASGLRNDVGLAFRPGTQELWSVENGVDALGDDVPPEEVNLIQEHQYYGWPWCYGDGTPDPRPTFAPPRPVATYCAGATKPLVKMQAHSAPLSLVFSAGSNLAFPSTWKKGIFVAFHGSYNRTVATGYKVVYIPAFAGHGLGQGWNPPTFDFAIGDIANNFPPPANIWRPAGLAIGPDGALYVARDNGDGTVYRITYPQDNDLCGKVSCKAVLHGQQN